VHTDAHAPFARDACGLEAARLLQLCRCSLYCTCVKPAVLVHCLLLMPVVLLDDVRAPHLCTARHNTAQQNTAHNPPGDQHVNHGAVPLP
jgi:hypothetical protein